MILYVHYQKECRTDADQLIRQLPMLFPGIQPVMGKEFALPDEACDPSRFQYDAAWLLRRLSDQECSLWIVKEDLYYPGFRFLYGAALKGKAVVSTFRPDTSEGFLKEAAHELGHALGLSHCKNKCIMHPSASEVALEQKPLCFCPACQMQLKRKMKKLEFGGFLK